MIKLNILTQNLGANQLSYSLISSINKLVNSGKISPVIFYEELQKHHLSPKFPTFPIIDYYGQKGFSIATSLSTTMHVLDSPAQNLSFLYLFDLYWLRQENKYHWKFYNELLNSIPIVVRGKYHKKMIENCFNIKVLNVMENFNPKKLLEIINELQRNES